MNEAQQKTIDNLKAAMINQSSLGGLANVEVKYFHASEEKHFVSLVIEVGRVGDEGTMAEVFCRDRRHFFVGKKGGVSLISASKSGNSKTYKYKQINGFFNCINTLPF